MAIKVKVNNGCRRRPVWLPQDLAEILFWINVDTAVNVKVAGEANFDRIVAGSEEDLVLVLFVDESSPLLTRALRAVLSELEDIYGVTVIEVADLTGR